MFPADLITQGTALLAACRQRKVTLATAESCTGGLIAGLLTEIAGSSDVIDRGFVTYSNRAKQEMLGVEETLLAAHGAVSEPVARAMAEGACRQSGAALAVSVTGIAGPGGATPGKPVGLVYMAVCFRGETRAQEHHFSGNRQEIRLAAVRAAVELMLQVVR